MKSVFSALSRPSSAYCKEMNILCSCPLKTHCHGIHCASCCINIIHHQYRKTGNFPGYQICVSEVFLPLGRIEFFLGFRVPDLNYQIVTPRNSRKTADPLCKICRLVEPSHPFLSGMQGYRHNQLRFPAFQIFSSINTYGFCVEVSVFPTSIILEPYQ